MGHQGASWCGLNADGVLVLMAHQNYVRFKDGPRRYEMPDEGPLPPRSPSAKKSLAMIGAYFEPDRAIILPIAEFIKDGGIQDDGTWEPSIFRRATGDAYKARMQVFDAVTGRLLCLLGDKFSY
jgi:hypothetical protein